MDYQIKLQITVACKWLYKKTFLEQVIVILEEQIMLNIIYTDTVHYNVYTHLESKCQSFGMEWKVQHENHSSI